MSSSNTAVSTTHTNAATNDHPPRNLREHGVRGTEPVTETHPDRLSSVTGSADQPGGRGASHDAAFGD